MKIEEAITYAIMSDGHGKTTDRIADLINRYRLHVRKDGNPVMSAQVYAVICRYPSNVLATRARSAEPCTKEEGRIRVML